MAMIEIQYRNQDIEITAEFYPDLTIRSCRLSSRNYIVMNADGTGDNSLRNTSGEIMLTEKLALLLQFYMERVFSDNDAENYITQLVERLNTLNDNRKVSQAEFDSMCGLNIMRSARK